MKLSRAEKARKARNDWARRYLRIYVDKKDYPRLERLAKRKHASIPRMVRQLIDFYSYHEQERTVDETFTDDAQPFTTSETLDYDND